MRIAILRAKADATGAAVPSEVIDLIAHKVQTNIRELEGALTRVLGYAQLMKMPLSLDLATSVLQDIVRQKPLTVEQVLSVVADYYHVDLADLTGRSRSKEIVLPRQMAMYILREEMGASLPQIGEALGGRDHTTVMYAHEKMKEEIEASDQRRREFLAIRERLYKQ
jgi:chromosomal replication initiator protein